MPFKYRETVLIETPAHCATVAIVGFGFVFVVCIGLAVNSLLSADWFLMYSVHSLSLYITFFKRNMEALSKPAVPLCPKLSIKLDPGLDLSWDKFQVWVYKEFQFFY